MDPIPGKDIEKQSIFWPQLNKVRPIIQLSNILYMWL